MSPKEGVGRDVCHGGRREAEGRSSTHRQFFLSPLTAFLSRAIAYVDGVLRLVLWSVGRLIPKYCSFRSPCTPLWIITLLVLLNSFARDFSVGAMEGSLQPVL